MSNRKAQVAEIVNMRDQLVVMRERLFQLAAATADWTKRVEGLLIDCAAAGRVFGEPIALPDWNNVLATPGHQSALSLDDELRKEMERVIDTIFWNSPESGLDRTNNDLILLHELSTNGGKAGPRQSAPFTTLCSSAWKRRARKVRRPLQSETMPKTIFSATSASSRLG
jgi:hypothetical protein